MSASGLAPAAPAPADFAVCRAVIARHSRSFALASRLFAPAMRDEVCALYALFRRFDDTVDHAPRGAHAAVVQRLRDDLDDLYAGGARAEPTGRAFQRVVLERGVPREYFRDFLAGLAMDAESVHYESLEDLLLYAWRVAGTVGLVLCHVMGVEDDGALPAAAHLGIAMQLTNVARDVAEDWERGRLYLPAELLPHDTAEALRDRLAAGPARGREVAELRPHAGALAAAVRALLRQADAYYASADAGLVKLGRRPALAVAAARRIYAAIGEVLLARGGDVLGPRAVVPAGRKLALLGAAAAAGALAPRARRPGPPRRLLRFEELPRA